MTKNGYHLKKIELAENIWTKVIEYILITNIRSTLSFVVTIFQYLPKNRLVYLILFIHLKENLSKKFNLNLSYILIKAVNSDN